jgi:hypothetical protein
VTPWKEAPMNDDLYAIVFFVNRGLMIGLATLVLL